MERTKDIIYIRWNNFRSTLTDGFQNLLRDETMVDVTLAAEGKFVKAHRLVLSICSPYFKTLLEAHSYPHPIVIMTDVKYIVLSNLIEFMYNGQAGVKHQNIPSFLKLASKLQVKGLAGDNLKSAENLLECKRVLRLARIRKRKMIYSLSLRDRRLKLLQSIKNKKKIINRQRKKRSLWHTEPVKNLKQDDACGDSDSKDTYETSSLKESVIVHKHDDDSSDKYVNSSPSLLVNKVNNGLPHRASTAKKNLKFGIRDYIQNVTIEDLETDVNHDLLRKRRKPKMTENVQKDFQRDTQHVPLTHEKNDLATEIEGTSKKQTHENNVLVDDVQNTSQNHEENNLQSDGSQKVVESGVQNILPNEKQYPLQSEGQNDDLNVQSLIQRKEQCDLTNDLQYPLQKDVEKVLLKDVQYQKDVENAPPVDVQYTVQRDVPNYSPNDVQYPLRCEVQDIFPNNVPYPLQRDVRNASPYDEQNPLPRGVENASPIDAQYSSQRDVENISPNDVQYSLQRDLPNYSPNDVQYSLQRHVPNYSPHDAQYLLQRDVQNASPAGVEYPLQRNVQNTSPIGVQYPLQRHVLNYSMKDVQYSPPRNVENALPIDVEYSQQRYVSNYPPNDVQYSPQRNIQNASPIGVQYPHERDVESASPIGVDYRLRRHVQNVSPMGIQYPLQRDVQNVSPIGVQYPLQKHVPNYSMNDIQYSPPRSMENVSPIGVQYTQQRDVERASPIDAQYREQSNAVNYSLNSVQCPLQSEWQNDLQNGIDNCPNNDVDVYSKRDNRNDLQTRVQNILHNYLQEDLPRGGEVTVRSESNIINQSKVQCVSRAETPVGSQGDPQIDLRKYGHKNAEHALNSDANNVEECEAQFLTQTEAQMDSEKTAQIDGQNVLQNILQKDSHQDEQCVLNSGAEIVERNEVQSESRTEERFTYFKKDPRKNVQYALSSNTKIVKPSQIHPISHSEEEGEVEDISQNHPEKDLNENVQNNQDSDSSDVEIIEVHRDIEILTKMDSQRIVQCAVNSGAQINEQNEMQLVSQTHSQNSEQSDVQDSQENVQCGSKRGADVVVEQSEIQSAAQPEVNIDGGNVSRKKLKKCRHKNEKYTVNGGTDNAKESDVQLASQTKVQMESQKTAQSDAQNILQSDGQDSLKSTECVSTRRSVVVERNEVQSISQLEEKSDEQNISQNDLQKDSHENVQFGQQSDTNNEEEDDVQIISEIIAQPDAQNVLRNDAQDSQKNIQYAPKRRSLVVEESEVQSVSQTQTQMDSQNPVQNAVQDSRENVEYASKKSINDDEKSEVQSASQTQTQMDSQNSVQNEIQDSQENVHHVSKKGADIGGQSDVQSVSKTPSQIDLQNEIQDSRENVENAPKKCGDEQSEVQSTSHTQAQKDSKNSAKKGLQDSLENVQVASKRRAIEVEQKVLRNDLRKYRHRNVKYVKNINANNMEESKVQRVSQSEAEKSSKKDAQNLQKDVQYVPKRFAYNVERLEATRLRLTKVDTNARGKKQSLAQDDLEIHVKKNSHKRTHNPKRRAKSVELSKVQSVSQSEEKSDERNIVLNCLGKYRNKTVQNDRPSSLNNVPESQAQSISKGKPTDFVRAKRDELENVLQNIQLDVRRKKKKEELSVTQAETPKNPQRSVLDVSQKLTAEVAKSKLPKILRSRVQNTIESIPTAVLRSKVSQNSVKKLQTIKLPVSKAEAKHFAESEVQCISPEDRPKCTEYENNNKSSGTEELQMNVQTSVQVATNIDEGNIAQTELPSISSINLKASPQTRKPSHVEAIAKNEIQCLQNNNEVQTSSEDIQMGSQSDVPNVLPSDVMNSTQEGIQYMLSNNVPNNAQDPVQCDVENEQDIAKNWGQFTLPNVSQTEISSLQGQPIQYVIKYDSRKIPLNVLKSFLQNSFQNIQPRPVNYTYIGDMKNNNAPNGSQNVLDKNLQEKLVTPVQYVLTTRNEANNIPSSESQSFLQNPLQKIPQTPVQYVLTSNNDANNMATSGSQSVLQNYAQDIPQAPVQYVLKNDVNNTKEGEGESASQNDVQSNFSNIIRTNIIKVPSGGVTYITLPRTVQGNSQSFVQYPVRSNISNTAPYSGLHYILSNPVQVDPQKRVHYTVGTDVNNTAPNGAQVVQNDAQMNSESNVSNLVNFVPTGVKYILPKGLQINPQNHVQYAVRNDVRNVAPSELPKVAQSHVQNDQERSRQYSLICDVKNFANSGLQYHVRIGPQEGETQYTVISNANYAQNDAGFTEPNVVINNAQNGLNSGDGYSSDGEDVQEVIYENDDRFGVVIGDVEVETANEKKFEIESNLPKIGRPKRVTNVQGKPYMSLNPKSETANVNVINDDDNVDDFHEQLNDIQKRSKSTRTSFIWKYFIKYPSSATCRLCGKTFKGFRPHTSIECHLKTRHHHQYLDFTRSREEQRKQIAKDQFDHLFSRFYGLTPFKP